MISNTIIGNALEHWLNNDGKGCNALPAKEWRKCRNDWLRSQGIGGIIKNNKQSKSIPDWWEMGTQFWFLTEDQEKSFIDAFGSN